MKRTRGSNLLVVPVFIAVLAAGGGFWWHLQTLRPGQPTSSVRPTPNGIGAAFQTRVDPTPVKKAARHDVLNAAATEQQPNGDPTSKSADGGQDVSGGKGNEKGNSHPDPAQSVGNSKQPADVDLSETSWQDPFEQTYWKSQGWKFNGKSMHCPAHQSAQATFRRSYRKLMLEMQLEPLTEPVTFKVQLDAPTSKVATTITINDEGVIVSVESPKRQPREIKRKNLELDIAPEKPGQLRIAATGNRLLIVWNGRRILTCTQPAEQSGRDLQATLVSESTGFRISNLRIEGE